MGGGHKKEYAVYASENDDNSGRPLICVRNNSFLLFKKIIMLYPSFLKISIEYIKFECSHVQYGKPVQARS